MPTPKKIDETPEAVEVTPELMEVTLEVMEVSPPPYDPIENHPELLAELQNPTAPPEERRFAGQTHVDGLTNSGKPVKIPV